MSVEPRFDELVHSPLRLRICGLLRAGAGVDFAVLRDTLATTDATLSKNVKLLIDAGLVTMSKRASLERSDARRTAWLSLTPRGVDVFDSHVAALRQISGG